MTSDHFSWLHLSDLHVGQHSSGWLWPSFKAKFLDDLARLAEVAGPLNLVVFSGDLTQSGKAEEYVALSNTLADIWERLDKLGQNPPIFCVPGNHDLVRPPSTDAHVRVLKRWWDEPEVMREFWENDTNGYRNTIENAFANYTAWQEDIQKSGITGLPLNRGLLPGDVSASVQADGVSVGLIGLNSAFLQIGGEDYERKLALDPRQLNAVTGDDPPAWCSRHDVNFLVTHHPSTWLHEKAHRDFQSEIYASGRFTAHLYGHMHEADAVTHYRGGESVRKYVQSTSLFGLQHFKNGSVDRVHGYSVGKILFDQGEGTWQLWPRIAHVNRAGDRMIVPDYDFPLSPGTEFLTERMLISRTALSKAVVVAASPAVDLAAAVSQSTALWDEALSTTLYPLPEQAQHLAVRPLQQKACLESLRKNKMAWICADWGLGIDGFLWSVAKRSSHDTHPVFKVNLGSYASRADFLEQFATQAGCAFSEFCKALANTGKATLIFDEAPVGLGDAATHIEHDVEALARMVQDFCPEVIVFMVSRAAPRSRSLEPIELHTLDEPDTRAYIVGHPRSTPELRTPRAVSEIFRHTDGVPGKIDEALKALRIINLSELGSATAGVPNAIVAASESVPQSLVNTVAELSNSPDPFVKRAFLLLKVMAILPHGESLQRLKYFENQTPFHAKQAIELLDRGLLDVRTSSILLQASGGDDERLKVLVAPRPVRDYVLSLMTEREIDALTRKATSLYFGEEWRTGRARLQKLDGALTSDDGTLLQNPHSLVLSMLTNAATWRSADKAVPILNLCRIYCGALMKGKSYRNCATVCRDVLAVVPEVGYDDDRDTLELLLATSTRMMGEHGDAKILLERLLARKRSKEVRASTLLDYALCLQSLNDPDALRVAKEIIALTPKSYGALQARSIILEVEDEADKESQLLKLEAEARKKGANVVANNLVLARATTLDSDSDLISALREVHMTATAAGDAYNAARAAVKLGALILKETGTMSRSDLNNLIRAYQYFYGERSGALFLAAHKSLWQSFEAHNDTRNLLSLFRHSSFLWRLYGNDDRERSYVERLTQAARHLLTEDVLTADQDTAYFLVRATDWKSDGRALLGSSASLVASTSSGDA